MREKGRIDLLFWAIFILVLLMVVVIGVIAEEIERADRRIIGAGYYAELTTEQQEKVQQAILSFVRIPPETEFRSIPEATAIVARAIVITGEEANKLEHRSWMILSEGLLNRKQDSVLLGVIAHEFSHIEWSLLTNEKDKRFPYEVDQHAISYVGCDPILTALRISLQEDEDYVSYVKSRWWNFLEHEVANSIQDFHLRIQRLESLPECNEEDK